jgi:hypothetical protein
MQMPGLKRFANPDVTRAVANLVWLGLERLTQIAIAIAISSSLARHVSRDGPANAMRQYTFCSPATGYMVGAPES